MRIVHTESVRALGGQSLRLIAEVRRLRELGHECALVGADGSEFHRRVPKDVPFVPFRFQTRELFAALDYLPALRLLRRLRPDVLHTHSSRDAWTFGLPARLLGIPIVRGRHVSRPLGSSPLARFVYTHLADAFTASGETVARRLIGSGVAAADDVFITPAGIDFARFDASTAERGALRRELGLTPAARLVGTACNLRRMKGIDVLLAAFETLRAAELDAPGRVGELHLILAGKTRAERFDAVRARHPGRVHALGFRDDIERVLAGLDVLVLASRSHEGIPGAILQAMALGTPVVATDAGGIPDVVRDGETGVLVPKDDAPALAAGIQRVLEMDPAERERMRARALERARADYGLDTVVGRYVAAYEQVVQRAGEGHPRSGAAGAGLRGRLHPRV